MRRHRSAEVSSVRGSFSSSMAAMSQARLFCTGDSARTIIFEICGWHGSFDICLPRLVMRFWLSTAPSVASSFRACAWLRCCQPWQRLCVAFAESRNVEKCRRKVGIRNLRTPALVHAMLGGLCPQSVADSRSHASSASRPLRRHVEAYAHRLKVAKSRPGIVDQLPAISRVDHNAYAFNRNRCLCDRRCKHYLALAFARWRHRPPLLLRRQIAVEREYGSRRQFVGKQPLALRNVGLSGQKSENVALVLAVSLVYR